MSEKIFEQLSTAVLEGDSVLSAETTQKSLNEGIAPE